MKKLIILISVIIIFFIFFLFMYFSSRNYEKRYVVDNVKITEKYDKEKEYYFFNLKYKNINFEYAIKSEYTTKRRLINKVETVKEEKTICLIPKSDILEVYPLCYDGNNFVFYNETSLDFNKYQQKIKTIEENYKDININYLNDKTILVWNYKGFNYLSEKENKQINILKSDTYNLDLVAKVNNYLVIPDYDNKHSFKKMYVINLKNGDIKEWELEYEIYFNSYIVGVDKKSIYLFDNKNEIEYEIRPDKRKMRKIKYKAIIDDKWENISLGELNKKIIFSRKNVYNYEIINNNLYLKYLSGNNEILISSKNVKDIVYVENDTVYYLVDDKLYMHNSKVGEVLLLEYFEWNFNYDNMIYLY